MVDRQALRHSLMDAHQRVADAAGPPGTALAAKDPMLPACRCVPFAQLRCSGKLSFACMRRWLIASASYDSNV